MKTGSVQTQPANPTRGPVAIDVELARQQTAASFAAGKPGLRIVRELTAAFDEIVVRLFNEARARLPRLSAPVALVAIGGYGRRALCPGSDLDLLLVTEAPEEEVRPIAEAVLHPLWDARVEVGCNVRGVAESVELARHDLASCTSLLDARLVAGSATPFEELRAMARRELFGAQVVEFVQRLYREKVARHARFGDTVFLLEPNLKQGHGGQRDLLTALWAAKARWRVETLQDLLVRGLTTERQVVALRNAREFILRARIATHLVRKRREDRLLFEIQEAIAPQLFGAHVAHDRPASRSALAPAVEALVGTYYRHARAVVHEGERLLERAAAVPPSKPQRVVPIDHQLVLFDGKVSVSDAALLRANPSLAVRLFRIALELGKPVHSHTADLVADLAAEPEMVALLGTDPAAGHELVRILNDLRDAQTPSLLEQLHRSGVLAAVTPDWGPVTCFAIHDIYHVFTVDQHSLYAVAFLKSLARGEQRDQHPVPTEVFANVRRPAALFLGLLLHDVGKPLGKGHSETGARIVRRLAERLGYDPEDARRAEWLVRHHLLMSHLSQRRDINDPKMVSSFATQVGDEETLSQLYLLTFADLANVSPGNLTRWKEMLLTELYQRTLTHLRRTSEEADRSVVVTQRLAQVRERLAGDPLLGELEAFTATVPDSYFAQLNARQIATHLRLARRRAEQASSSAMPGSGPPDPVTATASTVTALSPEPRGRSDEEVVAELYHRTKQGFAELLVCARDEPGLLARFTGVLWAHRISVLGARIASRSLGGGGGSEALDVFYIWHRDLFPTAEGEPLDEAERTGRWAPLFNDLQRVVRGEQTVDELLALRHGRSTLPPRLVPPVATEIEIDNQISDDFTVIDVYTLDRMGVLYTICATLERLGLDVGYSKVATEAHRVDDVFYVRDREYLTKITDGQRIDEIKVELRGALAALPERG